MAAVIPQKFNDRHFLMAMMHLRGMRNCDIAERLGYTESWISTMLTSPLMQEQLTDLRKLVRDSAMANAMEMIEEAAVGSVQTLLEIRDRKVPDTDQFLYESAQRRGAANDLLDRNPRFAKRTASDVEHTVRLVLSATDLRQLVDGGAPSAPAGESNGQVIDVPVEYAAEVLENGFETAYVQPTLRTLAESIAAFEEAEA